MKRLAIITTHPIQYNAPLFKMLTNRGNIKVKVFYTWGESVLKNKYDPGFDKIVEWDIPLLEGYEFEWVDNTSSKPGSYHFRGIITPSLHLQVERFRPDTLLVFGWSFQGHLQLLRRFKSKVNILFRGDSTLLNDRNDVRSRLRYFILRWVYTHVDKALYAGYANKEYYLRYGLKESQLKFAPHAVENRRFSFTKDYAIEANQLRLQLGIAETDVIFLFAGKFEDVKNPFMLINAFNDLLADNVHLVMVGSGSLGEQLRRSANGNERIHFLDFQNQSRMPAIYHLCDVYVLPSRSETWGLAVNEAMAAGKAVIVSDKCGCSADLVQDGVNGFVFKSGSTEDLTSKLYKLTNKEQCYRFGKKSEMIIGDYSLEKICEAVEGIV